ncbi:Triosephosphate isomerase [Geodia barretti]|uniref:Triosephosphate isomerase n=1 Tax=Geodia barretti TaxID=519541 RepID=A0AA35R5H5_GEOBA|nr:Triosephosphate isomerase [Geodia barretti]
MTVPTPIVAGNWKMNTDIAGGTALAAAIAAGVGAIVGVDLVVCPPFVSLAAVRDAVAGSGVSVGAQNMHADGNGAFTGEIAPPMLVGLCEYVIIGHSERRQFFGETDDSVGRKVAAAVAHELRPIVCVGETLSERESGNAAEVIRWQVTSALAELDAGDADGLVIAYEPVWAIGTGRAATPEIADQIMGGAIRSTMAAVLGLDVAAAVPLLYGGSVNAANAAEFAAVENVNGALVGGASLDAGSFLAVAVAFAGA